MSVGAGGDPGRPLSLYLGALCRRRRLLRTSRSCVFYFSTSQVAAAPQGHGRHAVTPADRPLAILILSIQKNPNAIYMFSG
jgi:hypothetical protein